MFELFEKFSKQALKEKSDKNRAKYGDTEKVWNDLNKKKKRPLVLDENGERISGGYRTIHGLVKDHKKSVLFPSEERLENRIKKWKEQEEEKKTQMTQLKSL